MGSSEDRRGWTLIELLVVIALVTIVVGRATMSLGAAQGRILAGEGARLATLLSSARDQSVLASQTIRVRLSETGYRFEAQSGVRNVDLASDELFRPRLFPAGIRLESAKSTEPRDNGEATLVFTPWGDDSEFSLLLTDGKRHSRVRGDASGIHVEAEGG